MRLDALIDRSLAAWNARDPDAIAADFAPDATTTRLHLYFDVNELGRQIGAIPPPGSAGEKMVVTFRS
jgi:hypothetical protein